LHLLNVGYDMPDDEILGFWGKRPFLAKRIPRPTEPPKSKPAEVPAKRLLPAISSFAEAPTAELLSSWRMDPTLLRHCGSLDATSEISNQA
jgi:hypothetical protein